MRKFTCTLLILAVCAYGGYCGDIVVGFSPSNLRFGQGSSVHLSNFDDVIAASLGYTPDSFIWKGLTVTTPFQHPSAIVVLGIRDGGVSIKLEGTVYDLKEDITFRNSYEELVSLISSRAQRPVYFEEISGSELAKDISFANKISVTKFLDIKKDEEFLKEMSSLPNLVDYIAESSTMTHGGQDIIFVDINSFASLVTKYGRDSTQVREASEIIRMSVAQTIASLEKFYNGKVLVITAMLNESNKNQLLRRKRESKKVLFTDKDTPVDLNLGAEYNEDYPVIFNIVLFISIALILSLIAISVAIAFMDPGRDSIIYRMTNPRMKKDQ